MLPLFPVLPLLLRLRTGALAATGLAVAGTLAPTGNALAAVVVAPGIYATSVPILYLAPANASGEAVMFQGSATITSRLSVDPDTGARVLLATFDATGIVGTGAVSKSRYVLTSKESLVLPHAAVQSVSVTFPMEPTPTSVGKVVRTGVANLTLQVDFATGAVVAMTSGTLALM